MHKSGLIKMQMMRMKLLSRNIAYNATHGITTEYKDYLSIPKNQGTEGLCWAYSLTSAIEMKYALKSGNRLMLDPLTLKNNSVEWFKKYDKHKNYSACHQYDEEGGYSPLCAAIFMNASKTTMKQQDGNDSYIYISNISYEKEITTVKELYDALDEYKLLYSSIYADDFGLFQNSEIIDDYYFENESINHVVVITSVGTVNGYDGLYVEILNSWGYGRHYDGLIYIKVADNETDILHNNFNMFYINVGIDVELKTSTEENVFLSLFIVFFILFVAACVVILFMYCTIIKLKYRNNNDIININNTENLGQGLPTPLSNSVVSV